MLLFFLDGAWSMLCGAEFLRGRNLEYVRAARALGCEQSHHHGFRIFLP